MLRCGLVLPNRPRQCHEHADVPHPLALLRARRKRPRGSRTAEQRNERATADHSITSSARARSDDGISSSSALAVLRLMTKNP
jgi:hypothetical protein